MKSIITTAALAAILTTSSAFAFWGGNGHNGNGNFNSTGNGAGHGTGAGEAEFSFSFSGKAKGNMDTKADLAGNGSAYGYNSNGYVPYYYSAPYGAPVAPKALKAAPKAPVKK